MKSPIILRIFRNNQLVEVKQFDKEQIIFGHEADVVLDGGDPQVSPIHCLIELRDSGYYLCDLGSANGTFKNGNQILDEPISSGDNIGIGSYRIQFFVGVPKPKTAPDEVTTFTTVAAVPQEPKQTPSIPASVPKAPVAPKAETPKTEVVQPPPKLPDSPKVASFKASSSGKKSSKKDKTFAPPSEIKDLREYLKPSKGPVVEVIIAWHERVLSTHHFSNNEPLVTIGSSEKANIVVPSIFINGLAPLLELTGGCRVIAQGDMAVEVINAGQSRVPGDELLKAGKSVRSGTGQVIRLEQGEIVCLSIAAGNLQIFVRYVPATNKPLVVPTLDFSSGELTVLVASLVIVSLLALYISVYTPTQVAEEVEEEQVRLAQFIYNKPPPTPTPVPEPRPTPVLEKVEVKPQPTPPPKQVKVDMSKPDTQAKGNKLSQNAVSQTQAAKAAEVMPKPSKVERPKKFTSVKQGGAVKVGNSAGANAQSKDVTKVGLLSAFGGGGVRKQLDEAYSGSGELLGMANEATGRSGQNENRAGDDIGSRFKDTGAGGKGTATQGIAGVGTKGRGSGMSTYGSGMGLGGKGSVTIDAGGADEGWEGSIDKEAVRRVIRSILNQIRSCYERQLRVDSSLEGKVVIQFEIIDQGRVRTSRAKSSTLNNSAVESCVAARIKEARFPEPPVGTTAVVDYPFLFGAQK